MSETFKQKYRLNQIENLLEDGNPDFFIVSKHGLDSETIKMIYFQNDTLISSYERNGMKMGAISVDLKINCPEFSRTL